MEVTELMLWAARLGVLVLMYLFLLALILALRADARAPQAAPAPAAVTPQSPHAPVLAVTGGTPPTTGQEFPLVAPLEIGRDATCQISIPSRFVSSHHARIYAHDGGWIVEDLGSTNGTLINGQPLSTSHALRPGDCLVVGDTEFCVR